MMNFDHEYEVLIRDLKSEFLASKHWELECALHKIDARTATARSSLLQQNYKNRLRELREFVQRHFARFDAEHVSSLIGLPTKPLQDDERLMHRIWLGGALPSLAIQAMRQWEEALDEVERNKDGRYRLALWVWDAAQVAADPLFLPGAGSSKYTIGRYAVGRRVLSVNSVAALARDLCPAATQMLAGLHARHYFIHLSELLRLLVLRQYGGMYLDVDTVPYKSATVFLAKPELPDYVDCRLDPRSGKIRQSPLSWLSLSRDEHTLLAARKSNPSVTRLAQTLADGFGRIDAPMPDARAGGAPVRHYASLLQAATDAAWKSQADATSLAHDEMARSHSVLHDSGKETVLRGLRGMRLLVDARSRMLRPLDAVEQASYRRCVDALDQTDWRLAHPAALEGIADLAYSHESPRMAYAPRLRAEAQGCHYRALLSEDDKLDRVNSLFAAYAIHKNAEQIGKGYFWQPTRGEPKQGAARKSRPVYLDLSLFDDY